jgi:hypothetical protein
MLMAEPGRLESGDRESNRNNINKWLGGDGLIFNGMRSAVSGIGNSVAVGN